MLIQVYLHLDLSRVIVTSKDRLLLSVDLVLTCRMEWPNVLSRLLLVKKQLCFFVPSFTGQKRLTYSCCLLHFHLLSTKTC